MGKRNPNDNKRRYIKWEDNSIELLKLLMPYFTDAEIGKMVGRSSRTIENVRRYYGLSRNDVTNCRKLLKNTPLLVIRPRDTYKGEYYD